MSNHSTINQQLPNLETKKLHVNRMEMKIGHERNIKLFVQVKITLKFKRISLQTS